MLSVGARCSAHCRLRGPPACLPSCLLPAAPAAPPHAAWDLQLCLTAHVPPANRPPTHTHPRQPTHIHSPTHPPSPAPAVDRSTLALFYSPNLLSWVMAGVIDYHMGLNRHFAYPHMILDGALRVLCCAVLCVCAGACHCLAFLPHALPSPRSEAFSCRMPAAAAP